jgi:hypothetical protein
MALETVTEFLGWATILNFAILILSTMGIVSIRGFISRVHGKLFGLESADLSRAYFLYLAHYKICVIVFSFVPYLALKIMA